MDLNFDDATLEFQSRGARIPRGEQGRVPDEVLRHRRGLRTAPALGQGALRRRPVGDHVAREVRRPRRVAAAVGRLRGGVLPRRRARTGERQRHVDARADAVRARHRGTARPGLPKMASGEEIWAQAWSEPESGSDLASLRSTATKTDGGWLLNGQKIWSSRAPFGERAFGLFRSDPEAQRHKGPDVLHVRPEGRRHHGAPDRPARRRHRVRRDLPRRRVRARRRRDRRGDTRAGARR